MIVGLAPGIRLSPDDFPFALGAAAIGIVATWLFAASAPSAERRSVWLQLALGYAAGVMLIALFPVLERLWG